MKFTLIPVLLTLAIVSLIPTAYAQVDAVAIPSSSVFDASTENSGDRLVRAYLQITDFDISTNDHFDVNVIDDTGNLVLSQRVNVYSTVSGLIDFGSMVGYHIPINSQTGTYHLEVSIAGTSFNAISFSVI